MRIAACIAMKLFVESLLNLHLQVQSAAYTFPIDIAAEVMTW